MDRPVGGFLSDLASPKSFLFKVFNAASACSTRGSAAAKSFSQEACFSETSILIAVHFSSSIYSSNFKKKGEKESVT